MSDLDERLRRSDSKPARELRTDFTINLIRKLEGVEKKPQRRPKWMEYIQMNLHKPAIASLVIGGTLLLGGTAYAAVGGIGGIRAFFGGEKTLSDGSRVVQISTQNCPHVDAFNASDTQRGSNDSYYYKIKKGSQFSNGQVVTMVQGACEADAEGVANGAVISSIENEPQNKDMLVGDYADSVITAIGPDHLTIHFVMPFGSNSGVENRAITQTFTKIDPNVTVVGDGVKQPYSALKVGDHVAVVYRATGDALTRSETTRPDQVDAGAQTVVVITRLSQHMSQYYDFQKYNTKDFQQVVPCAKDASGYCSAEQYYSK